jgi:hypothetical protein
MKIRRKFICDVIDKYKKDHPQEYKDFLKYIEFRRSNADDKKFAKIKGTSEIRLVCTMPEGIVNAFEYAFTEEKLFEPKGELKWFVKKFPEFLIARSL